MLTSDFIGRVILAPSVLKVGVVTAFVGFGILEMSCYIEGARSVSSLCSSTDGCCSASPRNGDRRTSAVHSFRKGCLKISI